MSPAHSAQGSAAARARPDELEADILLDAGIALAQSLEMSDTLARVAQLTIGRLADLCVIDLLQEDGSIRMMASAALKPRLKAEVLGLRERHRLDAAGDHPVASVIRSGDPMLIDQVNGSEAPFTLGAAHARFVSSADYNSAIVAPLQARTRTLGSVSVLRTGDGLPYTEREVEIVSELARRAALAIDNSRLFSEVRSIERRLEAILSTMAEAITLIDRDGTLIYANQAAADLLRVADAEELKRLGPEAVMSRFMVLDEDGNELGIDSMPHARLNAGETPEPLLVRNIVRATGEERWLLVRPAPITDPQSGELLYTVNVYEDITEVKRAQLAESFMAEVSRVLSSSLDYAETLARVARIAVPRIADWCAVDVLSPEGVIERVAVHHADPRRLEIAERLDTGYPIGADERVGVAEVIRSGRARLYQDITTEALARYARDEQHLALLREIGATAVIVVPLAGPTRPVGALTLVSSESARRLNQADVGLAVRLGRRAGTAVESARLYTERARIADTLQAALLPERLPDIPGVQVRALYRASGELNDVGGDFYDVFELGDGRWMLAIGDVCGKGPRAAGVTALARHTLRTAAMLGAAPTRMLDTLHEALRRQPSGADLCTVCLLTLERRGEDADLTVSLAGHPHPLVIEASGEVSTIGRPGTLLGVIDPISINETKETLRPGQTLLLFTDGLPEAGRAAAGIDPARMLELDENLATMDLTELLSRIERRALREAGGRLRDDIAILAVRLTGECA